MAAHNTMTERLLQDAGITEGMRVLDIGSGPGDVSRLLAKMVGKSGEVIGLERDEKFIGIAQGRVSEEGLTHVRFIKADLAAPLPDLPPADAVVGRRVLMYLPDPAETIQRLTAALQPGGLVVFEETDSTMTPGRVSSFPAHDQVVEWVWETVAREGGNRHMGFALPSVFRAAGVTVEHLRAEAVFEGQEQSMADIIPWIKHRIIGQGVATEEEIDAEGMAERLRAEREPHEAYISGMSFGIWGKYKGD